MFAAFCEEQQHFEGAGDNAGVRVVGAGDGSTVAGSRRSRPSKLRGQ
jgi:hypothetical protein